MLNEYLPIAVFLVVGFGLGIVLMIAGSILGPRKPGLEKNAPYECGFEAFDDARMRFDVRFYLLAILFIVFDLEVAFLVPWAVVLDELGTRGLALMATFLTILVLGFAYVWKKGALEWE
jgi:NADH-quinone oxidoreductase subunit A